jgi:hypothetical protein
MIVSWIIFINSIPEIKIINVYPDFLSPLLLLLQEKQKEVFSSAEKCLKDLLKELDNHFESLSYEVEVKILEILLEQARSTNECVLLTAFEWINLFLSKYKYFLIQNKKMKSPLTKSFTAVTNKQSSNMHRGQGVFLSGASGMSNFVLEQPFEMRSEDLTFTYSVSDNDRKIPFYLFPKVFDVIVLSINNKNQEITRSAYECNTELLAMIDFYNEANYAKIKLFEEVIKFYCKCEEKDSTLELVLQWIIRLFKKYHDELYSKVDDFVESVVQVLCHKKENIFDSALEIICEIARHKEENIEIIFNIVMKKLSSDKNLLESKGLAIIKKFCSIISVDKIYLTSADVLLKMKQSVEFSQRMINILNLFLITGKVRKLQINLF